MYNPPTFLTHQIVKEILSEFSWPEAYEIREEDVHGDKAIVRFPKCILMISEGFESEMSARIANPLEMPLKYRTLMELSYYIYEPVARQDPTFEEPQFTEYFEPYATAEKVKHGIRDICILIQAYLLPCIQGDFSLVEVSEK